MSLRLRLVLVVGLILASSLAAGVALILWNGSQRIEAEMTSAMNVGWATVSRAINSLPEPRRTAVQLADIVRLFDGDRHVQVRFVDTDGRQRAVSVLPPLQGRAPAALEAMLAPPAGSTRFTVPGVGLVELRPDPRAEIAEIWRDLTLQLATMTVFLVLSIGAALIGARRVLSPLAALSEAFRRLGRADYAVRVDPAEAAELKPLAVGFNAMAERLSELNARNLRLAGQLTAVQDEERADLARNLHDEVGPYLFAIDVDATAIGEAADGPPGPARDAVIAERAASLRASVAHVKRTVRSLLGRLRPGVVVQLGLAPAVRELADFWEARHPGVVIDVDLPAETLGVDVDGALFVVIGEALANALRHGRPTRIDVSVRREEDRIVARVADDGGGLPPGAPATGGFGILGMRERTAALGGRLDVDRRVDLPGLAVTAIIPTVPAGTGPATFEDAL